MKTFFYSAISVAATRPLFTCPSYTPPASKWDSLLQAPNLQESGLMLVAGGGRERQGEEE